MSIINYTKQICKTCKIEKELSSFYFREDSKTYRHTCKECRKISSKTYTIINKNKISISKKKYRQSYPARAILHDIRQRCNNPKNIGWNHYGGRGIKNFLTEADIKLLMERDGYYIMKQPSIDRKDNDGNYEYFNCRFIELKENVAEKNKRILSKKVFQYDLAGNFIKEWFSAEEAAKVLNIDPSPITHCCKGLYKSAYKYVWKR